jgi:cytochrome c peroxidase
MTFIHGIGIIRHNVVALARQAEQLINSGDAEVIDRPAIQTDMSALGRFLITKKEADIAAFKTPDLRNVLVTGPYFHDGSQEALRDVINHYNKGDGLHNPYLDQDIEAPRPDGKGYRRSRCLPRIAHERRLY